MKKFLCIKNWTSIDLGDGLMCMAYLWSYILCGIVNNNEQQFLQIMTQPI